MQDGPPRSPNSSQGLPDINSQHRQEAGSCDRHVGIERPCGPQPSVKECRQRPRAAARRTRGDVQEIPPQAQVRTPAERLGRDKAKRRQRGQDDEEPGNSARKDSHSLFLPKGIPLGIRKFIHGDQDEVDKPPDAAPAERYELQDAETHVTQIETVNSQRAEKD